MRFVLVCLFTLIFSHISSGFCGERAMCVLNICKQSPVAWVVTNVCDACDAYDVDASDISGVCDAAANSGNISVAHSADSNVQTAFCASHRQATAVSNQVLHAPLAARPFHTKRNTSHSSSSFAQTIANHLGSTVIFTRFGLLDPIRIRFANHGLLSLIRVLRI